MINKDIKKRTYYIVAFKDNKTYGNGYDKNDLVTAFYCFRDLINSGLYYSVVFRVETVYKCGVQISAPELNYNVNTGVKSGKKDGLKNYYYDRFKKYISEYGTTKNIIFA